MEKLMADINQEDLRVQQLHTRRRTMLSEQEKDQLGPRGVWRFDYTKGEDKMLFRIGAEEAELVKVYLHKYYSTSDWEFKPQSDSSILIECSDSIGDLIHAYLCGYRIPR